MKSLMKRICHVGGVCSPYCPFFRYDPYKHCVALLAKEDGGLMLEPSDACPGEGYDVGWVRGLMKAAFNAGRSNPTGQFDDEESLGHWFIREDNR